MAQNCSCHGSGGKHSEAVAAVLERPRYSPGLILEDSDLTSAVDYTQSLSRLLFRNLFGCGVICGLLVSVEKECGLAITVAPGLALDGCGDPIEVPRPVTIAIDRSELEAFESQPREERRPEFWVVLCGREKMCAPRPLVCESDEFDAVTQPTRIRALAEVSLLSERPECVCDCGPRTEPIVQFQNAAVADDEVDCHGDHETRIACAPDCGCGTACACGCCLLLAHVWLHEFPGGAVEWMARNRGVRRFIRPKLLPDPAERRDDWRQSTPAQWASEFEAQQGTAAPGVDADAAPEIDAGAGQAIGYKRATTAAPSTAASLTAKTGAKAKTRRASKAAGKPPAVGETVTEEPGGAPR